MTKIRFDHGSTVTIQNGFVVQAPSPELTALLNALVASLPGELDADIARGIIEKIGVGEIVLRDPSRAPRLRPLKLGLHTRGRCG